MEMNGYGLFHECGWSPFHQTVNGMEPLLETHITDLFEVSQRLMAGDVPKGLGDL